MKKVTLLFSLVVFLGCGGGGGGGSSNPAQPLAVDPGVIDLGEVAAGTSASTSFTLTNQTSGKLHVVDLTPPNTDVTITGPGLPLELAAGESATFDVQYSASGAGVGDGLVDVKYVPSLEPLSIPVLVTSAGEQILDYGTVVLDDSGFTPYLSAYVPKDGLSLTLEGLAGPDTKVGLEDLVGPQGRSYVDSGRTDNYLYREGTEVFSTTVPNTDRSTLDLVKGGGTYHFRLYAKGGKPTSLQIRAIVKRAPNGDPGTGTLDANVWLAHGIPPSAANAASDSRLMSILATADTILSEQGIHLGTIRYYDIASAKYDLLLPDEMPSLFRTTASAADVALNVFFVESFAVRDANGNEVQDSTTAGESPTISGPARNGTRYSGIAVVYDTGLTSSWIGAITAHEACHFLGLYHTVEQNGTFDIIDDTPNCPADNSLTSACPFGGAEYLMFWMFQGGTILTPGEGKVLRAHPLVTLGSVPPAGGTSLFLPGPSAVTEGLPGGCATPTR